jgi:hypothetical protein
MLKKIPDRANLLQVLTGVTPDRQPSYLQERMLKRGRAEVDLLTKKTYLSLPETNLR